MILAPSENTYRNIFGKTSAISNTKIYSSTGKASDEIYEEEKSAKYKVTNETVEMGYVLLLHRQETYTNI